MKSVKSVDHEKCGGSGGSNPTRVPAGGAQEAHCYKCSRAFVTNPSGVALVDVCMSCDEVMHPKCNKGSRHEACCGEPALSTVRCLGASNSALSTKDITAGIASTSYQLSQTADIIEKSLRSSPESRMEFSFDGTAMAAGHVTMETTKSGVTATPTFSDSFADVVRPRPTEVLVPSVNSAVPSVCAPPGLRRGH